MSTRKRKRKRKRARAVALSFLMVLSVVAGSLAFAGAASGTPGGMVGVPQENIGSDLPPKTPMGQAAQDLAEAGVMTSDHADTLNITVTSPGRAKNLYDGGVFGSGPIAIVLTDDVNHDSRRVAFPKKELVDILGGVPEQAYGTHTNGTRWTAPVEVEDGWVVVETPSYSTNTITWSGMFTIEGYPADDGFEYTYTQNDTPSNYSIDITGAESTEEDLISVSGVSDGETIAADIAGNSDPTGGSITFIGNQYTGSRYSPSGTGDTSISVNGDAEPTGPNGGEPGITFTGVETTGSQTTQTGTGDGSINPDGNLNPVGPSTNNEPEITFTGSQVTGSRYTPSGTGNTTVTINGDDSPTGPNSGEPEITITGNENVVNTDSLSQDSATESYSTTHQVGGNTEPHNVEVTFTGSQATEWDNETGTVTESGTPGISPAGNLDPAGPGATGKPTLSVTMTAVQRSSPYDTNDDQIQIVGDDGGDVHSEVRIGNPPANISSIELSDTTIADADTFTADIYIVEEAPDGVVGEGVKVADWDAQSDTISLSSTYDVSPSATNITVEFVTQGTPSSNAYVETNEDEIKYSNGYWLNNDTGDHGSGSKDSAVPVSVIGASDQFTVDDGYGNSVTISSLAAGESATKELPIDISATELTFSDMGGGAEANYTLEMKERTRTEDPYITIEGSPTSYTGTLSDGSSTTLSASGLIAGDNLIEIGLVSLSADAPAPEVDFTLSYDEVLATEDPEVDIDGDGIYEVSHSGVLTAGSSTTQQISSLTEGDRSLATSTTAGPQPDWTITYDEELHTHDPSVDIDGDGTAEASYSGELADGATWTAELAELTNQSQTVDTSISSGATPDWSITYSPKYATEDPSVDVDGDGTADASHTGILESGQSQTVQLSALPAGSVTVDTSTSLGPQPDWTITYDEELYTDSPSADIDGDSTAEVSHSGKLSPGESANYNISPTLSDDTWTINTVGGPVDIEASITERTVTENVTVYVNGNETGYSGVLDPGNTTSLTTNTDWVNVGGENNVTVEVATTLSADAPVPSVDLYYAHTGADDSVVDYEGQKWSERYNVSKTFGQDQSGATLTIPFAADVVRVRSVEYSVNGGSWSSVPGYSLDNTTLTVDLGSVTAGDEVRVRTTGSKVNPIDGSIQVLDPTYLGKGLDTKASVVSTSGELKIQVGDTPDAKTLHYTYNESWSYPDTSAVFDAGEGQTLYLGEAAGGDEFRVSTIPVTVAPSSGDVRVTVTNATTTEPEFHVEPGPKGEGSTVAYTFVDAQDGKSYILYSSTNNVVRDSGTASSPLTLEDDDSEETLIFQLDDSDSDDGGGISGPVSTDGSGIVPSPDVGSIWLVVGALAVLLVLYWLSRRFGSADQDGQTTTPSDDAGIVQRAIAFVTGAFNWAGAQLKRGVSYLRSNPYVAAVLGAAVVGWLFITGAIGLPEGGDILLLTAGVPIVAWIALRRWGGQSLIVWAGVTVVALIIGLNALGTDIFGQLTSSEAFPIFIIGTLGLAYYALQTYQTEASTPDEQTNVTFKVNDND